MTNPSPTFTHINQRGDAHMVDVSEKAVTARSATAESKVRIRADILERIQSDQMKKGDVLATVRIAAIQASKKCAELIPLCHPLPLTKVSVDIEAIENDCIAIRATCKTSGKTGVEMEALTAASVGALTLYDMCKAMDKGIVIESTRLLEKTGGKSGDWSAI